MIYQVSDCIWIQLVYARSIHPSVKGKTSVLNYMTGGKKKIMFEAYNIVLEHFFCTMSLNIVYNPKIVQGEDENNLCFFLIRKWHGYVRISEMKRSVVFCFCLIWVIFLFHNLTMKHVT